MPAKEGLGFSLGFRCLPRRVWGLGRSKEELGSRYLIRRVGGLGTY